MKSNAGAKGSLPDLTTECGRSPRWIQRGHLAWDPHPSDRVVHVRLPRWGEAQILDGRDPVETIQCQRCGEKADKLERAPFRSELGERILAGICQGCWADWLKHQTALINHYGLDPRDSKAKEFLYKQVEEVLMGGGEGEKVDTSKQGTIEW